MFDRHDPPPPLPPSEVLLEMAPADLAGPLLRRLSLEYGSKALHRGNLFIEHERYGRDVAMALAEAFAWLERECLIVHVIGNHDPSMFVLSRAGMLAAETDSFARYRQALSLPRTMLHPRIAEKSWALFITGELDTAVFAAFKEVEIAVAVKSGANGTSATLMKTAFHADAGPLRNREAPYAEREGMMMLFAGAFATFRNPAGHRSVTYDGPAEAAELLVLASHLMRVVDARARVDDVEGQ